MFLSPLKVQSPQWVAEPPVESAVIFASVVVILVSLSLSSLFNTRL